MYPHSEFKVIDNTEFSQSADSNLGAPLMMYAITADKGPEGLNTVAWAKFQELYGNVSFVKHGQPMLQTARSLQAGANVLVNRLVAPDALLANAVIVAKTKAIQQQKLNSLNQPLYLLDGAETTDPTGATAIMVDVVDLKFEVRSVTNIKTITEVMASAEAMYSDTPDINGYKTFPLIVVTDIGRGDSDKKFRISPDYAESKRYDYVQYQLEIIENTSVLETLNFSFNPSQITGNRNISIASVVNTYSNQVRCSVLEVYTESFIDEITEISGLESPYSTDILFGKTKANKALQAISLSAASVSLSHVYGISLANGSNGSFGSKPINTVALEDELVKFFTGQITNNIYDLDEYKIDAIVDANYPEPVKRAIEDFVEFRQDLFYFRDSGFVNTFDEIAAVELGVNPSMYSSSNMLSYDVIDPYSKKQVQVTVGYTLSKIVVEHFKNGRHRPLAGKINGAIIADAIKGTINYLPRITPGVNQKEDLVDLRVNYASYFDNELVIESQYTSQDKLSQFSYVNNVLAVQEVIKAIRTKCPKIRYSFLNGEDLETYRKDVESVINKFTDNFKTITFEYIKDPTALQNKIFKASIQVSFKDYAESEYFTIYAIN